MIRLRKSKLVIDIVRAVFLVVFALIWEWASRSALLNPIFFGRPSGIGEFLWTGLFVHHTLVADLMWTLAATAAAFGLGGTAGILFGLAFVAYPALERFLDPIFAALNAMPRIALAPLFLLWFGLGLGSKIALGFSLTFFIVLSSTIAGVRGVSSDFLTLATVLGATPAQVFLKITLPSAVPTIFSGLRLGLIYALLGVIASEILAAQHGLGQALTYLAGTFQTNGVFGVLILLAILGMLLTRTMTVLENHLLRWR